MATHWQVALWNQKARDGVVVWDYHVVLVLRPRVGCPQLQTGDNLSSNGEFPEVSARSPMNLTAWVYDYDSRLPAPCTWRGTFLFRLTHHGGVSLVSQHLAFHMTLFLLWPSDAPCNYHPPHLTPSNLQGTCQRPSHTCQAVARMTFQKIMSGAYLLCVII